MFDTGSQQTKIFDLRDIDRLLTGNIETGSCVSYKGDKWLPMLEFSWQYDH
jgi:hypothetical protein